MPQNFLSCDRDQSLFLPPDLRDWLPEDHLAWLLIESVDALDLASFYADYRADGHGRAAHDLRRTFGTRMAAAGVPLRTIQEWIGHRDFKTTLIYADYQPAAEEAALVEKAFGQTRQTGVAREQTGFCRS
jgi:Phage integrase family